MQKTDAIADELKALLNLAITRAISEYRKNYPAQKNIFSRKRVLTMQKMIQILLSMQGGSLKKELYNMGIEASASAFVQQRNKIPYTVFEDVFSIFNSLWKDPKTYKGYRVFAVDGTVVNMARNPQSESFVKHSGTPNGYNQLHINPLYDVMNKTYLDCMIQPQPKQDEIGALAFMLAWYDFPKKTLIVADRGYESYNMFAHLLETPNVDFLIRVKQNHSAMREIKKLPLMELDVDVSFTITTTQTNVDKSNGYILVQKKKRRIYDEKSQFGSWDFPSPYPMKFRVVRFLLKTGEYETLVTSLPRSFTLAEIRELYHARWGIETAFRELKYGVGLVNLHGKKDEFVMQEIYTAMIISNFCNRITGQVVLEKKNDNLYEYKVDQSMAIDLCRKFYREENADSKKLVADIKKYTVPVRPDRQDQRKIKSKFFTGFVYRVSA